MSKPSCQITFNNQCATYYAGQRIEGHIKIRNEVPKKIRGITLDWICNFVIFEELHAQKCTGTMSILIIIQRLSGIRIRFLGESQVNWSENATRTDHKGKTEHYTIYYFNREEYVRTRYYFEGSSDGKLMEIITAPSRFFSSIYYKNAYFGHFRGVRN